MKIRKADANDLLAVEQISKNGGYPVMEFRYDEGRVAKLFQNSIVLVAEVGGEPLGYAALTPQEAKLEVRSIEVRDGHQNQGIATALLNESEKKASELGKKEIFLFCHPRNRGAIGFYYANGFEKRGMVPSHYSTGEPAILFSKKIE